jgi:transcriptional regulator with XRE-family HTH domain
MTKRGPKATLFNKLGARFFLRSRNKISFLMHILAEEAMNRGQGPAELATEIGISYPYLTTLIHGKKPASSLSLKNLKVIAAYLQVSEVQVFVWAGLLNKDSFSCDKSLTRISAHKSPKRKGYKNLDLLLPKTKEEFNKAPKWCQEILLSLLGKESEKNTTPPKKEEGAKSGRDKAQKTAKTTSRSARRSVK